MPAADCKITGQRMLVGLLALAACASNLPEPVQRTAESPPATADAPALAAPIPEGNARFEQLEASLEAYEQQLASNEARLQAMGVRVAQRALTEAEKGEAKKNARVPADDRFAPPPPDVASVGDAAASKQPERAPRKDKTPSAASKSSPTAEPVAPAPTAPRPRPATNASGRAAGGHVGPAPAGVSAEERDNNDEGNRCSELCDLASSTCDLEAKICDLATRHAQEPRYAAVCQRAGEDCRIAGDACTQCSP